MEDERWDETFMSQLGQPDLSDEIQEEVEEAEDDNQNESLPIPKITSYKEAITALENIQNFLENHGHNNIHFNCIHWGCC